MTTAPVLPDASELLANARAATVSPELRSILGRILDAGAGSLFETHVFAAEQRLFAFEDEPALWIVGRGQVYVERRSEQGRCLRPMSARPGWFLGTVPGGGEALLWPPEASTYARAVTMVATAKLPEERFSELLGRLQGIERAFRSLDLLQRVAERIDTQLRTFPGLTHLPAEAIADFVHRAKCSEVGAGEELVRAGEVPQRLYAVLDGAVVSRRAEADGRRLAVRATAGHLVGAGAFVGGTPSLDTATPDGHALVAELDLDTWRALLASHPMARRGLEVLPPEGTFDLVLVQSDAPRAPLPELTALLARTLRDDFGDDVAIVHLARPGAPDVPSRDRHGTPQLTVRAASASDVERALREALHADLAAGNARDLLFLHPTAPEHGFLEAAAPVLSRVAWLTPSSDTVPAGRLRDVRVDRAALLRPVGSPACHVWPTGTPRLRLDLDVARRRAADGRPLADATGLELPTTEGIRRWGRALTERIVGLALGGGGSPGFAHVALIRALEERGLPIDVVAGTSFGALVGAWYAGVRQRQTPEPARLQTMLDAGRRLNLCLAIGMLDTGPLAHLVDRQFGGLRLSEVEMPFFPVSSEVDSGTVYVGRGESLGRAVQMSGAFPPFFPPVIRGPHARLVDGGFVNNVPASILRTEGASFVIASNSIGVIEPRDDHHLQRARLRRVMAALNPVGRVEDAIRSAMMLFHRIGDAQGLFADASFESAFTGIEFWNFNRGPEVIEKVQDSANVFADRVAAAWQAHRKRGAVRHLGVM